MPAVLTHKSIMLLARRRLAHIRALLDAKTASGSPLSNVEVMIRHLAHQAHRIMSTRPHPGARLPGFPYLEPLGEGVSKFAVMGSMGPDIAGFSKIMRPGQEWVFDTVHKGNPDFHKERVVARTSDFTFAFWRKVETAIGGIPAAQLLERNVTKAQLLERMRAYTLGHLCHVAADVISHPFVNDLEWHRGFADRDKFDHSGGEGSLDAKVARQVLRRESTREGQGWAVWWPTEDEVPPEFHGAYADALELVYSARSGRPTGFAGFEEEYAEHDPPALDAEFIRDGYALYRSGIVPVAYDIGYWGWWGVLSPVFLLTFGMPIVAAALPGSAQLFKKDGPDDAETAWSQLLTTPLGMSSAITLAYGIWLRSIAGMGFAADQLVNLLVAGASLLVFAILAGVSGLTTPWWLRWLLCFGIPAAGSLYHLIRSVADAAGGKGKRRFLFLFFGLPLAMLAAFLLLFYGPVKLAHAADEDADLESWRFWVIWGVWVALWSVAWFVLPKVIRDAQIPEKPEPFPADDPHLVRLFDDSTLWVDPSVDEPDLGDRFYASGRRPLLKLWWTGDGDLFLRSRRYQLEFAFDQAGTSPQVVSAPIVPMTAHEYALHLTRTVVDGSSAAGHLQAAVAHPQDLDYELPAGATFADHGDEAETLAEHDSKAQEFRKLGKSEDDAWLLHHAPKSAMAVRFGRNGPVVVPSDDEAAAVAAEADHGFHYVYDPEEADAATGNTVMDYAAELAAMLCMGAASHVLPAADRQVRMPDNSTVTLDPVHQVFRNWNLDRRRVNEWRMLVSGGAVSEKGGDASIADPAMLQPLNPGTWRSNAAGGEPLATRLGWVPLLRKWLDVARRPSQDTIATTTLRPGDPTNRELSEAMAFLFELPPPARAPGS